MPAPRKIGMVGVWVGGDLLCIFLFVGLSVFNKNTAYSDVFIMGWWGLGAGLRGCGLRGCGGSLTLHHLFSFPFLCIFRY